MPVRSLLALERPWEEEIPVWEAPRGGYRLEEIRTQWDYELEGYFLAHCLGTKDADEFNKAHRVFSLRDRFRIPHCTVLLQRNDTWSPYGQSADLGTEHPCYIDDDPYWVLQVRGRNDDVARWEFYKLVLQWFMQHGGKLEVPAATLMRRIGVIGDRDLKYHYGYFLDESVNHFTWSYKHEKRALAARLAGESL